MKILVVSLLRVGDVLMSAGVLRDLRAKHPDSQIDLLVNSQCMSIAPMLSSVNNVIEFDRNGLQRGLGEASVPFFESYEKLSGLLDRLEGEDYDLAINLTQNRLSGWLMSLIEARERRGLVMDAQGRGVFGSNWFRYMNQQIDLESSEVFHYNDIFRFALGVDTVQDRTPALMETAKGLTEAQPFIAQAGGRKIVCIQALSSDVKKDWGLDRFANMIADFSGRQPETAFAILAAPFEVEKLRPLVNILTKQGITAILAVTSFEGAYSLLKRSQLLITLDTSLKHLAAHAGTKIVEVCVGSSDPYRTGADSNGAVIIRSRESCSPCPHSSACHRDHHACAKRIAHEAVSSIASEVFENRRFQLKTVAEEYGNDIEVLRVDRKSLGFWMAPSVTEGLTETTVARWIDLICRKLWLNGSKNSHETVGSEMLYLTAFFRQMYPTAADYEWKHLLEDFERRGMEVEGRINGFKAGIRYLHGNYEDPKKMKEFVRNLMTFREKLRASPLFASFRRSLDLVIEDDISPAFTRFRHIVETVNEIETRTKIHLRILRAVGHQMDDAISAEPL